MLSRENYRLKVVKANLLVYLKLVLKQFFGKNFRYRTELYCKSNFFTFLKRHIISMISVILIPIIVLTVFYFIDGESKFDFATAITTYLCTTYLAVLVYYNSWKQERSIYFSEAIHVDYIPLFKSDSQGFMRCFDETEIYDDCDLVSVSVKSPKEKIIEYKYTGVIIKNLNINNPIKIKINGVYLLNEDEVINVSNKIKTNITEYDWLEYKQDGKYFCGFCSTYFDDDYFQNNKKFVCYLIFEISTIKNETVYYIIENEFQKNFLTPMGTLIDKKNYDKLIAKHGISILKSLNTEVKIRKKIFDEVDYLSVI